MNKQLDIKDDRVPTNEMWRNEGAYTLFASQYDGRILRDVLRVLENYDETVPPPDWVLYAMQAYVYMSDGVDDLIREFGGVISDELRVFLYDQFDRNPSDDELTANVVEMLNDNPDIDNVDDACEYFVRDWLEYIPTKHQAKIIEYAAREKLGAAL